MFHIHAAATPDGAFSFELDMPADLFADLVDLFLAGGRYEASSYDAGPSENPYLNPSYYLDLSNR